MSAHPFREDAERHGHCPMPVLKAVRAKCLDCSGGMVAEVTGCIVKNCASDTGGRHGFLPIRNG